MNDSLDFVRTLDPTATADPATQVTAETRADLLRGITATPVPLKSASPVRRRLVPVLAAAAAVAAITVFAVHVPGDNDRPPQALGQALSFTTEGKVLKVRIIDPEADAARFNAEFQQHGLNIALKLLPASPSIVGQNVAASGSSDSGRISTTMLPAGCVERRTYPCVPEFTIPLDFQGNVDLYIGRAAKPGEDYLSAGAVDGRGEPMEGLKWEGEKVAKVVGELTKRGLTAEYRVGKKSEAATSAPADWVVKQAIPASADRVILFVEPK